jgi:adenylate cyclase
MLAQELSYPLSIAQASVAALKLHQHSREGQIVLEQSGALVTFSTEHGLGYWIPWGTFMEGWAIAKLGQEEKGITQMREGLLALQTMGAESNQPYFLACLAETYEQMGQTEEGLRVLAEAVARVDRTEEREWEAELYRLRGELTLQQFKVQGSQSTVEEAEEHFHKAIDVARKQQAKSLELRAATSIARLWQQQGKGAEAHKLLSEVYNWFTEGFGTKDLQEAKVLLKELLAT